MDDVDSSALVNEKFLQYNSTTKKWQGADVSGGVSTGKAIAMAIVFG